MSDNVQDHVQLTQFSILELIYSIDINASSTYDPQGIVHSSERWFKSYFRIVI